MDRRRVGGVSGDDEPCIAGGTVEDPLVRGSRGPLGCSTLASMGEAADDATASPGSVPDQGAWSPNAIPDGVPVLSFDRAIMGADIRLEVDYGRLASALGNLGLSPEQAAATSVHFRLPAAAAGGGR